MRVFGAWRTTGGGCLMVQTPLSITLLVVYQTPWLTAPGCDRQRCRDGLPARQESGFRKKTARLRVHVVLIYHHLVYALCFSVCQACLFARAARLRIEPVRTGPGYESRKLASVVEASFNQKKSSLAYQKFCYCQLLKLSGAWSAKTGGADDVPGRGERRARADCGRGRAHPCPANGARAARCSLRPPGFIFSRARRIRARQ